MSTKANFMPAQFAGAFEMWSPDRLVSTTVTQRLGGESWLEVRSSRDERYEEIVAIVEDTQETIIAAFRTGTLTSYVHIIDTGLFYVVPARVWDGDEMMGDDAMGYLDGRLYRGIFDSDYHRSIPTQLLDTPLMVLETAAMAWIKGSIVSALPATLLPRLPEGVLKSWFDALSLAERDAKNSDFVQAAKKAFPNNTVGENRMLEYRRARDGARLGGRPKIED